MSLMSSIKVFNLITRCLLRKKRKGEKKNEHTYAHELVYLQRYDTLSLAGEPMRPYLLLRDVSFAGAREESLLLYRFAVS